MDYQIGPKQVAFYFLLCMIFLYKKNNECSSSNLARSTRLRNGQRPSIMAETKKEVERTPPQKRSRDDCCSNDDSPESGENSKGDTPPVAVTKRRKNNHDFDKNNRDPTGLVFDEAGSNSPTVAEIRECPTETTELENVRGSSNYCQLDGSSVTGGIDWKAWLSVSVI